MDIKITIDQDLIVAINNLAEAIKASKVLEAPIKDEVKEEVKESKIPNRRAKAEKVDVAPLKELVVKIVTADKAKQKVLKDLIKSFNYSKIDEIKDIADYNKILEEVKKLDAPTDSADELGDII